MQARFNPGLGLDKTLASETKTKTLASETKTKTKTLASETKTKTLPSETKTKTKTLASETKTKTKTLTKRTRVHSRPRPWSRGQQDCSGLTKPELLTPSWTRGYKAAIESCE